MARDRTQQRRLRVPVDEVRQLALEAALPRYSVSRRCSEALGQGLGGGGGGAGGGSGAISSSSMSNSRASRPFSSVLLAPAALLLPPASGDAALSGVTAGLRRLLLPGGSGSGGGLAAAAAAAAEAAASVPGSAAPGEAAAPHSPGRAQQHQRQQQRQQTMGGPVAGGASPAGAPPPRYFGGASADAPAPMGRGAAPSQQQQRLQEQGEQYWQAQYEAQLRDAPRDDTLWLSYAVRTAMEGCSGGGGSGSGTLLPGVCCPPAKTACTSSSCCSCPAGGASRSTAYGLRPRLSPYRCDCGFVPATVCAAAAAQEQVLVVLKRGLELNRWGWVGDKARGLCEIWVNIWYVVLQGMCAGWHSALAPSSALLSLHADNACLPARASCRRRRRRCRHSAALWPLYLHLYCQQPGAPLPLCPP